METAANVFRKLPEKGNATKASVGSYTSAMDAILKYGAPGQAAAQAQTQAVSGRFNAMPLIANLFSEGSGSGVRCITEVSAYRRFDGLFPHIRDMCRHKVAFEMSADDCMMYLGNSNYQKEIGDSAVYNDGSKNVQKLLPYALSAYYWNGGC